MPHVAVEALGADRNLARAALHIAKAFWLAGPRDASDELVEAYFALPEALRDYYGGANEPIPGSPGDRYIYSGPRDWTMYQKARRGLMRYYGYGDPDARDEPTPSTVGIGPFHWLARNYRVPASRAQ